MTGSRLHGSGFLVPAVEGRLVKAATYLTEKWGWLGSAADDRVVVRASVGRHREIEALQRDPEDLALAVAADVAAMAGTPLRPTSGTCASGAGDCRSTPSGTSSG